MNENENEEAEQAKEPAEKQVIKKGGPKYRLLAGDLDYRKYRNKNDNTIERMAPAVLGMSASGITFPEESFSNIKGAAIMRNDVGYYFVSKEVFKNWELVD